MTDPLIDRDVLASLMEEVTEQIALGNRYVTHADAAISYLRKVLTPEALDISGFAGSEHVVGSNLHRRIFGEDK